MKNIKDLVQDRMRLAVSEAELKVDATDVPIVVLCHVGIISLVQLPVYCKQNQSIGCN